MSTVQRTRKAWASDLVGVAELAAMFGVAKTTVSGWYARRVEVGFPEAETTLRSGPVFSRSAVLAWWRAWVPERGVKVGTDPQDAEELRDVAP